MCDIENCVCDVATALSFHSLCTQALHYKKYSTASDVWSFGCLMYEIWSLGHKPFEGYTNSQVRHFAQLSYLRHKESSVLRGSYAAFPVPPVQVLNLVTEGYRLAPPPGCPQTIYAIMMSCWYIYIHHTIYLVSLHTGSIYMIV